jgi:hypothetical protein
MLSPALAESAWKNRSSASSEVQQVPPTLMTSRRTRTPLRSRTPRVVHRQTVEGLTGLPPRSAGSRLAASAKERSFSVNGSMATAILLAVVIAQRDRHAKHSAKLGHRDANCTNRRSTTDVVNLHRNGSKPSRTFRQNGICDGKHSSGWQGETVFVAECAAVQFASASSILADSLAA